MAVRGSACRAAGQLRVKVVPGSSRDAVAGWLGDELKVRVSAPPERGRANAALEKLLARVLGVARKSVHVVSGQSSAHKRVEVAGLSDAEIARRLSVDSAVAGSSDVSLVWLGAGELERLSDIDRSEMIRRGYAFRDGRLETLRVRWDAGRWDDAETARHVAFCREHMEAGAVALGAEVDGELVGIGVLRPDIAAGTFQLAFLHVSSAWRRRGVSTRIFGELMRRARERGAERVYVSATPSESAVGFYLRQGFAPAADPIPELFELEPEDVHMVLDLDSDLDQAVWSSSP